MIDNWKNVLVSPSDTIRTALSILNKEALRIVLVINDGQQLLGTICDGDIRRALLNDVSLDDCVDKVMYQDPTTVQVGVSKEQVISKLEERDLLAIPVVDGKVVVGIETLHDVLTPNVHENPVFLMAGGFGTRLRPLTDNCPKPLLKIGDKPILETLLLRFVQAGFKNFYISTHYLPELIKSHFGDGEKWSINITYVHEDEPLGTGGALGLLPDNIGDLPIIMMNGDLLTNVNFEKILEFHQQNRAMATMCVREYEYQIPYGVINGNGNKILSMEEKPIQRFFVNAGIYVVEPEVRRSVKAQEKIDMPTILENQIKLDRNVLMFPVHEYWLDIGRMEDFNRAQTDFLALGL